ncbi:hypothetical protein B0H13DRAFT_2336306 [Mycena leptocephala]|nr:hypothetical protein B0H13DRAFT_2336306 [Mycena leptocephala]
MFSTKCLLAAVSAALLVGTANAFNGTANLGFFETTSCPCPPWNGPYAVAVPHLDQTVDAVLSGYYDDGEGTENIALSPAAFAALASFPEETLLSPVTWSFD